jgi:hypothetical protein
MFLSCAHHLASTKKIKFVGSLSKIEKIVYSLGIIVPMFRWRDEQTGAESKGTDLFFWFFILPGYL